MTDIKLFKLVSNQAIEVVPASFKLEKSLQELIERNLEACLGIRFLASEFNIQGKQRGRIDTLGLDENYAPVIIEYKRSINENVINQGLYYLDWLLNHKSDFKLLVLERFGSEAAAKIDWSIPRLVCIANGYTHYDVHAVEQINRNIDLIRYQSYKDEFLLLEMVRGVQQRGEVVSESIVNSGNKAPRKSIAENLDHSSDRLRHLYDDIKAFIMSLGDDVQMKTLKFCIAFRRLKNFACLVIQPKADNILVYLKIDPDKLDKDAYKHLARDVRGIGHQGTGDLELTINSEQDLKLAFPLIAESYARS